MNGNLRQPIRRKRRRYFKPTEQTQREIDRARGREKWERRKGKR